MFLCCVLLQTWSWLFCGRFSNHRVRCCQVVTWTVCNAVQQPIYVQTKSIIIVRCPLNIAAWTKWPTFYRRHIQKYFPESKWLGFYFNVVEVCSQDSNWSEASISSGKDLVWSRKLNKPLPETILGKTYGDMSLVTLSCGREVLGSPTSNVNIYSGADQRKHQSSASLAFVRGIHRWPVNSPHKWPVTRKMFPFDDVIM